MYGAVVVAGDHQRGAGVGMLRTRKLAQVAEINVVKSLDYLRLWHPILQNLRGRDFPTIELLLLRWRPARSAPPLSPPRTQDFENPWSPKSHRTALPWVFVFLSSRSRDRGPKNPTRAQWVPMNRLTAACGLAFVLILGVVVSGFTYDAHITAAFNAHKEGAVGSVVGFLYAGLQPRFSLFTTVFIAALVAAVRRKAWLGVCYALTVALTWAPVVVMKVVFQRPRPDHALLRFPPEVTPADWSYPSGHTAFVGSSGFGVRSGVKKTTVGSAGHHNI
ncbi:phosphatase PAP2 family protein [Corynebacterium diphtheriae]|uniref:phosphatase PAP2 family protein n=1 Tax=Corynebacterium diphtheriae TaxID=1717 RepID=UPI002018030F|nr:phosphatase PAP2 family protein [Corynebacterium diphtheriae]